MVIATELNDPLTSPAGRGVRLTSQERDILARSATGWSATAVAEDLGLTPESVRRSLAAIIARVGARSKIEAAMIAVREGLIDVSADPDEPGEATTRYRPSSARPVARLRSWAVAGWADADRSLTLAGACQRRAELRRDRRAEVDAAAS
jgi:DNA-binding CsgD family transcriptional regulator